MSTDKDELLCKIVDDGKAAAVEDENKLTKQKSHPESRAYAGPHSTMVADDTKRFKLSSIQVPYVQESPRMSQPKARKASGSPVITEEKRRKGFFNLSFSKGKKEKGPPCDKMSSTSISHKLIANEDSACHLQRAQADILKASVVHQENYFKRKELPASIISCPMGFSVDFEEDLYRDADEIEREKVLLEIGTDSSDFLENKLSIEPEVDIMDYCQEEWRGNTSHAECIRKGYEAVSHKFISIRRVRGDNYCALRATLFQALSQAGHLPQWLQKEDLISLPEKLMVRYEWITQWRLRHTWTSKVESLMDEIKDCLMLLKRKWKNMSDIKTFVERQAACDELFKSEEEEYKLYEAVKFLMLSTAIQLYEDSEKGKEVPVFSWLLFARDTSSNPSQLMENHLNQLGHTGGLEQVEMFLLAYALQHTIQVYRLYKYKTEEFITLYPNDPEETWPMVTLITEDDRHYNIPARMCEETSV
uniref:Protein FAM105B-like protein n=1 Tax=Crotalus horridus TaxID=35024 RepID=A0A0K8S0T9_CROHD